MPIIIDRPQTGEPFGPGFLVSATTDFVGPLALDSIWTFDLTAPPNESSLLFYTLPFVSASVTPIVRHGSNQNSLMTLVIPEFMTGNAAQLRVSLDSASTSFHEEADVQVVIDREAGSSQELAFWIQTHPPAAGATLTEEEHNAVLQTNVGVIAMAGIDPISLIGDLANAFRTNPPLAFGSMSTVYDLTGDGAMPDIGDLLHTKLGIYFIADIPTNLSHKHGQSEEYPSRLIQWRTVHEVGGIELVTEVVDFITHGELWKWSTAKPLRIEYSVLPNVVVHARWWQFP